MEVLQITLLCKCHGIWTFLVTYVWYKYPLKYKISQNNKFDFVSKNKPYSINYWIVIHRMFINIYGISILLCH